MNAHNNTSAASIDRPLVLRARPDIQFASVQFSGQTAYVLKDPLTLELSHLSAEEFFLFEKLKQAMSLKKLQQAFQERFAPRRITPQQLQHGVNQLHRQGLLLSEAPGQGEELRQREQQRQHSERWSSWMKVLSFRLGSFDATTLVDGLHRRVRWIYSIPVLLCAIAILGYAAMLLIGRADEFAARLPSLAELAQPRYWLLWLGTVAIVKVLHELAHAVTCAHFGGRCHEIGVLLLAMIPCLYCDVSDIWRLPSKWQRIAVSAAGMIAELVIASLALIAWWHTQPGLLNVWCLSVVVVCSVGTVLVNANPLLRYDGYYILSDMAEVPNLSVRAHGLQPEGLKRWLLAEPKVQDAMLSSRQRSGLWAYAIAAKVYLSLVLLGIYVVLLAWARPYRLENLVYTLGVVTIAGMMFQPLRGVWRMWSNPSTRYRMRRPRLAMLALMAGMLLAGFFYFPITRSIRGPAVFVPANARPVYAAAGGELRFALPVGAEVQAGDTIARLSDADTTLALARQQGEYEVRRVRHEQLNTMRSWSDQIAAQVPTAQVATQDAKVQLAQLTKRQQDLTLAAPREGVIVAPPALTLQDNQDERLMPWSGSPLDARNLGSWIEPGTTICVVADPDHFEALVMIDQADVAEVRPGQSVRLLPESSPTQIVIGEVIQVARRSADRASTDENLDAGKYHLVQVQLASQDAALLVGSRATAKIEAQRTTLSAIVNKQLRQMFKLPW